MAFADLKNEYGAAQRAEGKAEAVLAVLGARGIAVRAEIRARIVACTDAGTLARWLVRAVTVASAADVVAPDHEA